MKLTNRLKFKAETGYLICDYSGGSSKKYVRDMIEPSEFIRNYEYLSANYKLNISDEFPVNFFEQKTAFGKKQDVQAPSLNYLIDFVIYAKYLIEKQIEIQPIVKELNEITRISELRHICSVACIASIYAYSGYGVSFPKKKRGQKNPDLNIDELFADVKVPQQADLGERHHKQGGVFETALVEDLCYDIGRSFVNLETVCKGIKQANLIFVDLSEKESMHEMVMWDEKERIKNLIPKPKNARVIYCCKTGNVIDGLPYSISSTYIDIDPNLWNFIKESLIRVTHRKL